MSKCGKSESEEYQYFVMKLNTFMTEDPVIKSWFLEQLHGLILNTNKIFFEFSLFWNYHINKSFNANLEIPPMNKKFIANVSKMFASKNIGQYNSQKTKVGIITFKNIQSYKLLRSEVKEYEPPYHYALCHAIDLLAKQYHTNHRNYIKSMYKKRLLYFLYASKRIEEERSWLSHRQIVFR